MSPTPSSTALSLNCRGMLGPASGTTSVPFASSTIVNPLRGWTRMSINSPALTSAPRPTACGPGGPATIDTSSHSTDSTATVSGNSASTERSGRRQGRHGSRRRQASAASGPDARRDGPAHRRWWRVAGRRRVAVPRPAGRRRAAVPHRRSRRPASDRRNPTAQSPSRTTARSATVEGSSVAVAVGVDVHSWRPSTDSTVRSASLVSSIARTAPSGKRYQYGRPSACRATMTWVARAASGVSRSRRASALVAAATSSTKARETRWSSGMASPDASSGPRRACRHRGIDRTIAPGCRLFACICAVALRRAESRAGGEPWTTSTSRSKSRKERRARTP